MEIVTAQFNVFGLDLDVFCSKSNICRHDFTYPSRERQHTEFFRDLRTMPMRPAATLSARARLCFLAGVGVYVGCLFSQLRRFRQTLLLVQNGRQ